MKTVSLRSVVKDLLDRMPKSVRDTGKIDDFLTWMQRRIAKSGEDVAALLLAEGLKQTLRSVLRSAKGEHGDNLYPNVEVPTGRVDDDGNEIREQRYLFALDVYQSHERTDWLRDYYANESRAYARKANIVVKAAHAHNPTYVRPLPFPDLDKGGNDDSGGTASAA